ncbi:SusC/RagA family TonB-linked outer membrane protein [Flavisolibacter tropicus]|uniref:TonB-dependent receptor n=1 Tax=Flavisolibacter tropicus TaxID=1492898 RepID=A0A172TXY2_9BACT|nr:SusC/RagA family TonB-linked outer membrane protein [Flavisolibacter tropicus]ANE51866.1 TonB-dependent receptor [Flavisolibacter tropicus]
MRRLICLGVSLLVLLFFAPEISAQTRTITGTVSSADGKALQGVTVTVRNTTRMAMTGEAGNYSISASSGESLLFTYVGYKNETVVVGSSNIINVTMAPGAGTMDEVVVIGYGTQKKGNVTGSVVNVNMEALENRPIADAGRGLQGVVPGLSVRVPSGEVGSDPLMRIRGFIGSVQGSGEPLILVDNVEVPSIQMVNPNDIESITVLKDAASSSIYGAKAAFGVILITTKKGSKTEGVNLAYSNNFSWQMPFKEIEIAGIDGLQYTLDAHKNMKQSGPAGGFWRISDESLAKAREWQEKYGNSVKWNDPVVYGRDWYFDGTDKYGVRIFDPVKAMVKDRAFTQNHNISLNGRSKGTKYNASFGYLGQEGMMKPAQYDDFTRYTGNLGLSTKVTDAVTIRGSILFSDRTKRYPNSTTGFTADPWLYLYRWSRLFPTGALENGEFVRDPYWDTKNAHTATLGQRYNNLNLGTTIDIMKNWSLVADYTYDTRYEIQSSSLPSITAREPWYTPVAWKDASGNQIYVDDAGNITESGGVAAYRFPLVNYITKEQSNIYKYTWEAQRHTVNAYSTYNLNLNSANQFKFTLGTNLVANKWNNHWSRKTNLLDNEKPEFNFAVGTETTGGNRNWDGQVGYFGRVNYAFDNKYLLEGNLRYDATSKFPEHLRWRWYPSFSAGWVLSNEDFMDFVKPVMSYAKFRGSWGSIGDQSVPNNLYLPSMTIGKNSWLNSAGEQFFQLSTPDAISAGITWQDIVTLNLGADLRFLNNKFGVSFDWFERQTKNMIISGEALPATYGTSAPQGNFGNLRTRGWEVALDFKHRFQNGLGINVTANVSDAVTDITKAADWNTPYENRIIDNTFTTGKRYGDVYGYVTDRLYQKGDFVYDASGNFVQETIIWQGTAKRTNKLAGNNPVYQTYFEDGNQILLIAPGDVKFVDVNGDGYITPGKGTFGDPGDRVVIGNVLPRYEYGGRIDLNYKSFDLSIMGQGVGKRAMWGAGQLAIPGYHVKDGAMPQAIAEDYWREDRTDAFYPRAWNLNGANSGFVMVPQTRYMLNMAYFRIKNITFGYNVSPKVLDRVRLKQARVYVSLENMITFDKLRGLPIDPEAISGYSMLAGNYNLGRTGTSNPTFKIASVGLNISL